MLSHPNIVQYFGMVVPLRQANMGYYDTGLLMEIADTSLHDGKRKCLYALTAKKEPKVKTT